MGLFVAAMMMFDCRVSDAQSASVDPVVKTLGTVKTLGAASAPAVSVQDTNPVAQAPTQFDAQAAFEHLKAVCEIGPRVSASKGMKKQQRYIKDHFKDLGGSFYTQPLRVCLLYTSPSPRDS